MDPHPPSALPAQPARAAVSPRQLWIDAFLAQGGDAAGRCAAQQYLDASTAVYHGEVIAMGIIPMVYDEQALAAFERITTVTLGILEKMTQRFLDDPSYRRLFGFSPLLEELVTLPSGYARSIPITRIDLFFDEASGDFMFCEFNTDGSSAMNEDREICNALSQTGVYATLSREGRLHAQELFDPWVEAFCSLSRTHACLQGIERPTVAIVDYQEKTTINELVEFRRRFEHAGARCMICDMQGLVWRDETLWGSDCALDANSSAQELTRIDAVYRRAVTSDIMADLASRGIERLPDMTPAVAYGAEALIAAVRAEAVCMIGGFRTQVAHSKTAFMMLRHPETLRVMSDPEREFIERHVPLTTALARSTVDLAEVKRDKDRWIIKPVDGYGTQGVFAGKGVSQAAWEALVDEHAADDYVLQEYCEQYSVPNALPLMPGAAGLEPFNVLTGLFVYDGRFGGVFTRAGRHPLIVGFHGGVSLGTFVWTAQGESPPTASAGLQAGSVRLRVPAPESAVAPGSAAAPGNAAAPGRAALL